MENILLIDYGSTFTKVVAVDASESKLLGFASAYTTVDTDVCEGLNSALGELEKQTGKIDFHKRMACSSAAGGLRMVVCGLVPELTAKAATLASMGAGAKIVGLYSYELIEEDITEIAAKKPDILLLTGGTDGGNKKCILHNAEVLAGIPADFPIIVAGNRSTKHDIMQILKNRRTYLCDNVMPSVETLNIEPVKQLIRDIFLERIIHAKGLTDEVTMPTPAAVLAATELLASDIGDLMAIDVGGATTDIYSIADGAPNKSGVIYKGLPEPYAKRTVEGDIGMRYSVHGIVEAAGASKIAKLSELTKEQVTRQVQYLSEHTDSLPTSNEQKALDFALAAMAIETATLRHAGTLEEIFTTSGRALVQTGKDLTEVKTIVMTGGALLKTDKQKELATHALYSDMQPQSLRPMKVNLLIDKYYILAAMGLLCGYAPTTALEILKANMTKG
ncbi:MAG: methylaspartate mutase accessory protein GlmL [Oscillospiraceae bacterium]|nr:methylaspartate mutase accessory protein GlmL [Oscillospiraceae bacterium]